MTEDERIARIVRIAHGGELFKYTDDEWRAINDKFGQHFSVNEEELRDSLEIAGTAYAVWISQDPNRFPPKAEVEQFYDDTHASCQVLLANIQQVSGFFWGFGNRNVQDPTRNDVDIVDVDFAEEQKAQLVELLRIVERSTSPRIATKDENGTEKISAGRPFLYIPKSGNAHKPERDELLESILRTVSSETTLNIPAGGGNENGPVTRFVVATTGPILGLGGQRFPSNAAALRSIEKLIKAGRVPGVQN